jgi:Trk-type K+ transport system membrane component
MAGVIARIATVAFAIGLDVLALSTAIGIKVLRAARAYGSVQRFQPLKF